VADIVPRTALPGVVLDRHDVQSVEGGHVGDRRLAPSIGEQPVGDLEPMARDANVAVELIEAEEAERAALATDAVGACPIVGDRAA